MPLQGVRPLLHRRIGLAVLALSVGLIHGLVAVLLVAGRLVGRLVIRLLVGRLVIRLLVGRLIPTLLRLPHRGAAGRAEPGVGIDLASTLAAKCHSILSQFSIFSAAVRAPPFAPHASLSAQHFRGCPRGCRFSRAFSRLRPPGKPAGPRLEICDNSV